MNYILKLHPSSGLLAESFVNTKFGKNSYVCGHCLRRHGVNQNNVQELSTYVSALKLILKRKENLKKAENAVVKSTSKNKTKWPNKKSDSYLTELLKVTSSRSLSTRMTIHQIKPSEVTAFAEQPGMTFSKRKFSKTKSHNLSSVAPDLLGKNLSKNSDKVAMKAKLLNAKAQKNSTKRLSSSNAISQKEMIKHSSSNTLSDSKFNMLELDLKMDIHPAIKSKTQLRDILTTDKFSGVKAYKVLPLNTIEVTPAPKKQITSTKPSELQQLVIPKVKEKSNAVLNPQSESETSVDVLNFLNQKPSVSISEPTEKFVSYIRERSLLPFSVDNSHKYSLYQFLHSYIDICIINKNLNEALVVFHNCRNSSSWKLVLEKNRNLVSIYNTLLEAYSNEGNWRVVKIITNWMEADKVRLNSESFAHVLFCLGNTDAKEFQDEESKKTEIIKIVQNLINNNYSFNDVFAKTKLPSEKTEMILSLFRQVLPSFEIEPTTVKLNSDCQLLKNLYAGQSNLQAPLNDNLTNETMKKLVEEQLLLEKNYFVHVKAVCKGNCTEKQKEEVRILKENWRKQIHNGFVRKLKFTEETEALKNFNLYMYLNSLPAETFVNIMMQLVEELVEYSGGYSPGTQIFHQTLGEKVYQCYQVQKKIVNGDLDKTKELYKKYTSWYLDPYGPARNARQEWQMLSQDSNGRCQVKTQRGNEALACQTPLISIGYKGANFPLVADSGTNQVFPVVRIPSARDTKVIKWPAEVLNKIGKYLYEIIISEVKFTPNRNGNKAKPIPVFYSILRHNGDSNAEEVKCHPTVANLFRSVGFNNLTFPADKVPMVCPPKPWKASDHGGYLLLPTDFVRPSEHVSGKFINYNHVPLQQLYATFDSLNALQAVPWIVNQPVLDVVLRVFENGGSKELSVPGLPESTPVPKNITPDMSATERFQQYKKARQILMSRKNEYGLWCEALYKLSLANHFRKRVFWLPQNCDFRGRVYPVPPHLNHLGADLFRSLLIFAKGKPLGPKGLDWLKIHAINLTGTHKKRPVRERLEHANVILPEILDSAEKPLDGNKWWTESDEPWQTLATCMEIKKALSSPNPETYVSGFPIHQDGSCNGLQHYAALGRDVIGAKSVNLTPCDSPQDVYSVVAGIVEQKRAEDARNGVFVAQALEGFIERKVVKQTVMTTVYGVTKYGAKLQIKKRLEEIDSFPQEHVKKASEYLSEKTFQSLNQMFCSAKEIQDWFIQCAHEICKKNDYVQWNTPLGLPVLQSYGKRSRSLKKRNIILPDSMKQKNAFPPNFVHSLDSSHMMLTALFCEQAGITFAAIHDCFWTHPIDVEIMNKICREQFISLHSQEILQNLSHFFKKCYIKDESDPEEEQPSKIFDSVPKTGDFSLDQVLNSVYFFS